LSQSTRVTDGETDRQTDRILIARPRLHCMQRGKNELKPCLSGHVSVNQSMCLFTQELKNCRAEIAETWEENVLP